MLAAKKDNPLAVKVNKIAVFSLVNSFPFHQKALNF